MFYLSFFLGINGRGSKQNSSQKRRIKNGTFLVFHRFKIFLFVMIMRFYVILLVMAPPEES